MARQGKNGTSMDEATHKKNFKPINIRDLFMDKNPRLARWIPGFIYRLLSRNFLHLKVLVNDLLPNESYKHQNKHFVITFGKPIPYQTFDNRFTPLKWAAHVQEYTYSLVENPRGAFKYLNKPS
jgi:hypothetical protein